jgi:small subunit ribosomal protein S6
MRRYETIFIIDPDLSDEERTPLFERLKLLFPQLGGFLVMNDEWGTRKLAYEIKKKPRGYYVRWDYCGTGALVNEIERFFRIDDRVLKYMTVLIDEDVDIESLKAEIAKAEAEKEQAAQNDDSDAEEKTPEGPESDVATSETTETETSREEL